MDEAQQARPASVVAPPPEVMEFEVERTLRELKPFLSVPLQITIELGRARIQIGELLDLGYHSVFELNKNAGNNLDIYVNNVLFGRGEVLVIEDKVAIKINEVMERYD